MVGVISRLASQPGKKIQEFVKEKAKAQDEDCTPLKQQTTACSVVHAIPGRIRLRVPRIAEDTAYLERLSALLKADPLIKSDRINSIAASIVIQYERSQISDEQMRSHLFNLINTSINDSNAVPTESSAKTSPSEPVKQIILACSLEIRKAVVASENCGLFIGKSGETLKGGALKSRINKLYRLDILI